MGRGRSGKGGSIEQQIDKVAQERFVAQENNDNWVTASGYLSPNQEIIDRRTGERISYERAVKEAKKLQRLNKRFEALLAKL